MLAQSCVHKLLCTIKLVHETEAFAIKIFTILFLTEAKQGEERLTVGTLEIHEHLAADGKNTSGDDEGDEEEFEDAQDVSGKSEILCFELVRCGRVLTYLFCD